MKAVTRIHPACWMGVFMLLSAGVEAAPPDAGLLLREEIRRDQVPAHRPPSEAVSATTERVLVDTGPKVQISAFRVVGLQALPEVDAQRMLANYTGQSLSLSGLHRVAEKFEQWLRVRGLFTARAYIPPQDINAGVVELRVLEGRVEGIDIKRAAKTRLSDEKLRAMLAGSLPPGSALEQERLERGLLLTNDLPATSARAVLVPGKELGGSRVLVEAAQGPVFSGNAELENTGNRFTGEWKAGVALTINDANGWGDQWSARGSSSQGTSFVRAGYAVPLGSNGWKAGVALIDSRYKLCCGLAVGAPDADGSAQAVSGFVSYPLIRTRQTNVSVSANWASRGFVNRQLGVVTSDKKSDSLALGVSGDRSDLVGLTGLGAYTTYSAQWTSGRLNLDGVAADKAQDAISAQSHGGYDKWVGQLTHLLRLSKNSALYAGMSAQWAGKNLDSSEKFLLGGPQGVRAYPSGEGSGDDGWLVNVEWRREIDQKWGVVAFVDYGEVGLHHAPWANWNAANTALTDRYALSGVGLSVVWTPVAGSQITATLANRLGDNPGRDAGGRDSDNLKPQPRLWVQASLAF